MGRRPGSAEFVYAFMIFGTSTTLHDHFLSAYYKLTVFFNKHLF